MKIKIKRSKLAGEIEVPGSKSHTIRAVAIAAMADGLSTIRAPLISGDTISSANAAEAFGAKIEKNGNVWKIKGTGGKIKECQEVIDLGNSGTSLRIFSGLAATSAHRISFDGDSSLRTRPMKPLLDALEALGVKTVSSNGKCPISITGPLQGGKVEIEGKSSQFVTALLFACPLAEKDTEISVYKLNERPYVEITIDWMERQGIDFEYKPDLSLFKIKGRQKYKAFDSVIPADFSTATFPLVASAVTGGRIRIKNLDFSDRQGDKEVFAHLQKMGMEIIKENEHTDVFPLSNLKGLQMDLNNTPDALPALAVAGCFAEGRTALINVPQARIKETDRIACMTAELRKMGAEITELDDGMIIQGGRLKGTEVDSHDDHRIAMSLAIAGMGADGETIIKGAEAAAVTYPEFIEDFRKLGADIEVIEN